MNKFNATICELATVKTGSSIRSAIKPVTKKAGNLRLLQMKNIDPIQGIQENEISYINFTGKKTPEILNVGDVVFVGRGDRYFAVCVERDLAHTAAAPHLFVIKIKQDSKKLIIPEYLTWYINHKRAQAYFRREAAGTAVTHVSKASLEELVIEVPSIEEQKHIVKINNLIREEKKITQTLLLKRSQLVEQILDNKIED